MLKSLVVFLILLFSLYGFAYAQTFNVSTTAQLRTAFENASVNGEDDIIILEAGTYKTTDDGLGTFKFSDTEAHNLTIKAKDGLTANDVILDGANTHQVLNLKSTKTATFTLDKITVRNGKASSTGGGIYTGNALVVTNSTISGNTAASWSDGGGGIYGYYGTVTVTNSTISGNAASSGGGGGIKEYYGTVTVTNSTISGNTGGAGGGGIYGVSSTVTVINSTISGNTAFINQGGGICGDFGTVTVTNSTILGNTAGTGGGIWSGGFYNDTVTITNSTISGNTAGSSGGGIYGYGTFINNIFDNNNSDIYFSNDSNVYNNYIDYTKLQNESSYTVVKKNNIQPSSGSLNFADSSFRLGLGSVAIDKGLGPNSTTFKSLITNSTTLQTVQTALQTDKDGNTRIIGSAIDLGAYEYGATAVAQNNCAATLSDSLLLHEPYFTINGSFLSLDLQYAQNAQFPSTDIMFKLANAGGVSNPSGYSSCQASALSVIGSNYVLRIPIVILGGTSYWLDLTYVPTTDGLLWFKLTGMGGIKTAVQNRK